MNDAEGLQLGKGQNAWSAIGLGLVTSLVAWIAGNGAFPSSEMFFFVFFFFKFIHLLFLRENEQKQGRGREREREIESEAGSRL